MGAMVVLTPDDLRKRYGLSLPADKDAMYAEFIETATRACLGYIGRNPFGLASISQYFDGGGLRVVLTSFPIVRVVNVYVDPSHVYSEALEPSGYRVDEGCGLIQFYRQIPPGVDVVKVDYETGWAASEAVPADVRACIALTVQHMLKLTQSKQLGVTSRTTEGGTEQIEQSIPPLAVQKLLNPYRMNMVI